MNILFYSTNTNNYNPSDYEINVFPSRSECWKNLCAENSDDVFFIYTQSPGKFVLEDEKISGIKNLNIVISQKVSAEDCADEIIQMNPDVAVACSFWQRPFDWLSLNDSLIGETLISRGIKTLCHPSLSQMICFDKNATKNFFIQNNISIPFSVYVKHDIYWAERSRKEIKTNPYKNFIFSQISKMNFPVVIKDTSGLSSYGMEVAVSFKETVHYLNMGKTNSDRLVEEYIAGLQCGCEIYSANGKHVVLPPFAFSVNRYGITSPKQSVKIGPLTDDEFYSDELISMLTHIAEKLNLNGISQVDLIYKNGRWFAIEINPRLSGMSETYAAALGKTLPQILFELSQNRLPGQDEIRAMKKMCNFKIPLTETETLKEISSLPYIKYLHQLRNLSAKQEREKGYCEIIFGTDGRPDENFESLIENLEIIKEKYPQLVDENFLQKARNLVT